jgi:uncharacterized membrane protein (DUF2068 family)
MLRCARKGHVTYAPDEPALRDRLVCQTAAGQAWRCLRCGTFVLGPPLLTGPADKAPRVRRGKEIRGVFILRLFAVERMVRGVIVAAAAYAIWRFQYHRASIQQAFNHELPQLRPFFKQLGYDLDHSKLVSLIKHGFTLSPTTLRWFSVGLAAYAAIEVVEAVGLWLAKRWGEYFAMVATSAGLPLEIYELAHKITFLRVAAFVVNLALVVYLVYAKRLFGVRGGGKAYEARLRSESIIDTEASEANTVALAMEGQPEPPPRGLPRRPTRRPPNRDPFPRPRPFARGWPARRHRAGRPCAPAAPRARWPSPRRSHVPRGGA